MFNGKKIEELKQERERWEKTTLPKWLGQCPECRNEFRNHSGMLIKRLYTPEDIKGLDYMRDLGFPGEFPFTRGVHATMYRGRLWTMRMFAGFGTAADTNKRFKYLLKEGESGLSTAFDYPTIMGYDSDHPMAKGEVGVCGVAISSLQDMEVLFDGIPLDKVTTSMTINGPAPILLAMYVAVGDKQGVSSAKIGGTTQNDNLKEFFAQKLCIFPPKPSVKLTTDVIEYCARHLPKWNPVSISGYHIREAGATAVQELAFTFGNAITYVQAAVDRGLAVDEFAPRLSFFFNVHNHFLEEVAKFRAARRIWARLMRERFGARDPRSMMLRFHAQTAGSTLTAQQPEVNVIRVTLQALAAVLGGAQSLHCNARDEALGLPTEESALLALRTQQVIAYESGVADTVDPLGGAYAIESLTNEIERRVFEYLERIEALGGMLRAIEIGWVQKEIHESAYEYQRAIESGEQIVVGVNRFVLPEERPIPVLRIDPEIERAQVETLRRIKAERDQAAVRTALAELEEAARSTENLMPFIIRAVEAYATLGEISDCLRRVFGEYCESA